MNLIDEIEVSYFRSFYKFKFRKLKGLNIIFGKNDAGKSNLVRALSLFFNGKPELQQDFDFDTDFCHERLAEANISEDVRKFLYVKIIFNTPKTYHKSLGEKFYIKRQWTVSRGIDYKEEISSSIPSNRRHIVTRLMNKIRFIHIPAIKDTLIFQSLLSDIHGTLSNSEVFDKAVVAFTSEVQASTKGLFANVPEDVSSKTSIAAPSQMNQLFRTLDFETSEGEGSPSKSLTRQRGDGVKARHIPELLKFISENDSYDYHIWGFEEPENSLDYIAAQSEAERFLQMANSDDIQMFVSTHSPSFYMLTDENVEKCYVSRDLNGRTTPIQGAALQTYDPEQAMSEGFYLPAVARALENVSQDQKRIEKAKEDVRQLQLELQEITKTTILTEGRTDAAILNVAWEKLNPSVPCPYNIKSCESGGGNAGSGNGGVDRLAICLKGISGDSPNIVIGLFDYDEEGVKGYKLDRNFKEVQLNGVNVKKSKYGKAYGLCLVAPNYRDDCKSFTNLPIEFMFRDEVLGTEKNGAKLELALIEKSVTFGGKEIKQSFEDVTHFKRVKNGKVEFANNIVPSFDAGQFQAFSVVFQTIAEIVKDED